MSTNEENVLLHVFIPVHKNCWKEEAKQNPKKKNKEKSPWQYTNRALQIIGDCFPFTLKQISVSTRKM